MQHADAATLQRPDEVTEFKDHVLAGTWEVCTRVSIGQTATVLRGQQHDGKRHGLGVALKLLDERPAFARLLLKDHRLVAQLIDEASDRLARTVLPAVNHEDLVACVRCAVADESAKHRAPTVRSFLHGVDEALQHPARTGQTLDKILLPLSLSVARVFTPTPGADRPSCGDVMVLMLTILRGILAKDLQDRTSDPVLHRVDLRVLAVHGFRLSQCGDVRDPALQQFGCPFRLVGSEAPDLHWRGLGGAASRRHAAILPSSRAGHRAGRVEPGISLFHLGCRPNARACFRRLEVARIGGYWRSNARRKLKFLNASWGKWCRGGDWIEGHRAVA